MLSADNIYYIAASPDGWTVGYNGIDFGPFFDRALAVYASIDAAWRAGRRGESAEVFARMSDGALTSLWCFGRDPYPRGAMVPLVYAEAAD
jgi:hypothetical protein